MVTWLCGGDKTKLLSQYITTSVRDFKMSVCRHAEVLVQRTICAASSWPLSVHHKEEGSEPESLARYMLNAV